MKLKFVLRGLSDVWGWERHLITHAWLILDKKHDDIVFLLPEGYFDEGESEVHRLYKLKRLA